MSASEGSGGGSVGQTPYERGRAETANEDRQDDFGQRDGLPPSAATATATAGDGGHDHDGFGGFDAHHPPSRELIDDCVHCGFCLPACPTYLLWGEEMDSPRGRVYLMKEGLEGQPVDTMARHFDQCLGCLACVTACPSGVQYDKLIEATRAQVERHVDRPLRERVVRAALFGLFPYPKRLRLARVPLRAYQRLGLGRLVRRTRLLDRVPTLAAMESLAPPLGRAEKVPPRTPAHGERRATVGLLTGCVQSVFFPHVNAATARVLAAEGCEVVAPESQGCCGALSLHMGREDEGLDFARRVIDAFESAGVDRVVVNAAGCGSAMKGYDHLLADDPAYAERAKAFTAAVRDVSEMLAELGPVAPRHPLPVTVAYHDACHLSHGQGVRTQPREALRAIPDLVVKEIAEAEICCGSAGVYNIVQPEPARELGDRKAANVLATGADVLVTANPGCLMQIRASAERQGRSIALAHTVEVLDASIRGLPASHLVHRDGAGAAAPDRMSTGRKGA